MSSVEEEKRCLVTGGRGFAARHLVELLIKRELFLVRVADLGPSIELETYEESGPLGEALCSGCAVYFSMDLRKKEQVIQGSVYIKSKEAPAKDVFKDLVEMCRGIQHPVLVVVGAGHGGLVNMSLHVDSMNRPHGILVQVLTDLDLVITKAYISSDGDWFMDVFYVVDNAGNKIKDQDTLNYIGKSLEAEACFINSTRKSGGLVCNEQNTLIELTGSDRPGLLSEICAVLSDVRRDARVKDLWINNGWCLPDPSNDIVDTAWRMIQNIQPSTRQDDLIVWKPHPSGYYEQVLHKQRTLDLEKRNIVLLQESLARTRRKASLATLYCI